MARGFDLLARQTETALASGIRDKRLLELRAIEIRPQYRGEIHLGVSQLPQQEVADTLLAAGADEQVRFGNAGQADKRFEAFFRDRVRVDLAAGGTAGEFVAGLRDVPAPAVIGGDRQRQRRVLLCQRFGLPDARGDLLAEAFGVAYDTEADIVLVQLPDFVVERAQKEFLEQLDFLRRAAPVLAAEGEQGEVLHALLGARRHHVAHALDPLAVTGDARQSAALGPAAVAVHDDGHVHRNGGPLCQNRSRI